MMDRSGTPTTRRAHGRMGSPGFSIFVACLSPMRVMVFTWLLATAVYLYVSSNLVGYTYLEYLMFAENSFDHSTGFSLLFLCIQLLFFWGGTAMVRGSPSTRPLAPASGGPAPFNVAPLVRLTLFTAVIASLWIGGAIVQVGGPGQLVALAASDNITARDILRGASFPGGRLLTYGFIGLATVGAAYVVRVERPKQRAVLFAVMFVSFASLAVLPIFVAGRITFVVACIGAFLAACLSARRFIGLKYVVVGAAVIVVVWTAKQYFTLGHIDAASGVTAGEQAYQGALFYFYNDMLNALNAVEMTRGDHTYGWFSLRFIFFMTFTDNLFLDLIRSSRQGLGQWMSAGEVPLLSGVYVDFWWFGSFLLVVFGIVSQLAYVKCTSSAASAAAYSLVFSGLLMSTHSGFLTSQELAYNFILIFVSARLCERPKKRSPRQLAQRHFVPADTAELTLAGRAPNPSLGRSR